MPRVPFLGVLIEKRTALKCFAYSVKAAVLLEHSPVGLLMMFCSGRDLSVPVGGRWLCQSF